jgi:hypothetical protein
MARMYKIGLATFFVLKYYLIDQQKRCNFTVNKFNYFIVLKKLVLPTL